MATYISSSDISDLIMLETGLSTLLAAKITKSDDAVEEMALSKGVYSGSIETTTVPYIVKEWAIAWVGRELCFDAMGKNNIDLPELEKYKIKYDAYVKRLADIEAKITPAILMGTTGADIADRATNMSGILFRN